MSKCISRGQDGERLAAPLPVSIRSENQVVQSASKEDFELRVDLSPVLAAASPFLRDSHHGQIQHFRASSDGKTDLDLVTFRNPRLKFSMEFVV